MGGTSRAFVNVSMYCANGRMVEERVEKYLASKDGGRILGWHRITYMILPSSSKGH
jgi:hypothetical protein